MATLIKLEIDSVAYEYSKWMWKILAGEKPESAVFKLSSGKGLTASSVSTISDKINLLMSKLEQFAPTAFLSPEDGKTFRKKIADWYSVLHQKRSSFGKQSKVIYLVDAVNEQLRKPYLDEIARLSESIKSEIQLIKCKKELTPDQMKRVEEVKKAIKIQKNLLNQQPYCTNDIITIFLHHKLEEMNSSTERSIDYFEHHTKLDLSKRDEIFTYLKTKHLSNEDRDSLKSRIKNINKNLAIYEREIDKIMSEYYRFLTPELIADFIRRYSGTFWDRIKVNKNTISITLRLTAITKKPTHKKNGKIGKTRRSKANISVAQRAKDLFFYPYKIISKQVPVDLEKDIDNDLTVIDNYKQWTASNTVTDFSTEYKDGYLSFWQQLNTSPTEDEYELVPPTEIEMKCMELTEYLEEITMNDEVGRKKVEAAGDNISKFCQLENYEERFSQLRRMIDSGTVKFPGGFAIGEITKMLNPDYIPNIR